MRKVLALLGLLLAAPVATWAVPGYPPLWQAIYPASATMTNLPVACNLCHINPSGGLNFNSYGAAVRTALSGSNFTAAVHAVEPLASTSAVGTSFTNLQEITASTQPGWTATSANLPAGIAGLLDPSGVITPPPVCTPPQILQGGVCVNPPCVPPQVLQGGVCVTVPVCTPPQVLLNNVCVTGTPPPPPPPPGPEPADVTACGGGWPMAGYGIHNQRYDAPESSISRTTVGSLALQTTYPMADSVMETLSIQAGFVYASDKAGNFSKINTKTGIAAWTVNMGTLTGQPTTISRVTPTLCNGTVLVAGWSAVQGPSTAYVIALSQRSGKLLWNTLIDSDPGARLYQSPIVYHGIVYIGVAGLAAEISSSSGVGAGPAPTFRGSVVALNLNSGKQIWKSYTVPPGYSGGGVWGDTLSIDEKTNTIFAGTGNNFSIPPLNMACILAIGETAGDLCQSTDNHIDSIVAFNMSDGSFIWSKQITVTDSIGCGPGCVAAAPAPDYDFPVGPQLFTITNGGTSTDVVAAGHKSGTYVVLKRSNGDLVWAKNIGPGSSLGGIERPCATDVVLVFCPEMNFINASVTLLDGTVTTGGYWTAMKASDGTVVWQKANPTGAGSLSAMAVANGVVFGCSLDPTGICLAMNSSTGAILWQYVTGGSNGGGPAIYNGRLYIGVGYDALHGIIGIGNALGHKVLVFSIPGQPQDPTGGGGDD
jgi:polyvinyl alcohol dehydrogenase (cytochrome)